MDPNTIIDAAFSTIESKLGTSRVSGMLRAALKTFKPIVKADLIPAINKFMADSVATAHAETDKAFAAELASLKPATA